MLIHKSQPCHHAQWVKPVAIHLPLCAMVEIYSPLVALDMLMYRWPNDHGYEYEEAKKQCLAAISGRCDIEAARESFLVASSHAHVLNVH
ncbi:DUF982 domain-containing protein [Agrobacterium larrymoorei]|uniref:DUF982 domain-containing protein n=1 Tax=Agrobacterium larrymoorei TaxID=160699 RepID=UPI001571755A|nr:DUF982 domain-containing protein [Agrobacterium larrymoorei]NTJ42482.1 DUF982 domain-containing protein [Agrobacterium larrymoorei]